MPSAFRIEQQLLATIRVESKAAFVPAWILAAVLHQSVRGIGYEHGEAGRLP